MALNSSSAPALPELTGLGQAELLQVIRSHPLPAHVAVIMDGNGRWATLRVHAAQHNSGLNPMMAFNDGGREELLDAFRALAEVPVSNFLLRQIAYAELWVTPTRWPDFAPLELYRALADFQGRTRRFGGV